MAGTLALQAGRLELESIVRAPLVVIADPVVAASGAPVTPGELGDAGWALLDRPAGSILAVANPAGESGLFVWAGRDFVAVVADPDRDSPLDLAGTMTVVSGRLVVGAPGVVAAWGPDADTGDGSPVRARVHRGRTRLGLIVVSHCGPGDATVTTGPGAAAVAFPTTRSLSVPLPLAG